MRPLDRRALFASGAAAALLSASGLSAKDMPRRGGRLRVATADGAGVTAIARGAVFETLTQVAPDGLLRGELAQSWIGNSDATHWHLTLRTDAVFHDGQPFTADHAIAALTAETSPIAPHIAGVTTVSDGLYLSLAHSDPHLPYRLADPALSITQNGTMSDDMDRWIGTGLYRVVSARNGRQYLGRRVDAHWKDGQAGWADTIETISITDDTVRREALRDGIVDIIEIENRLDTSDTVGRPHQVSTRAPFDDGRLAERWWRA